jgi:hypothetical protein
LLNGSWQGSFGPSGQPIPVKEASVGMATFSQTVQTLRQTLPSGDYSSEWCRQNINNSLHHLVESLGLSPYRRGTGSGQPGS